MKNGIAASKGYAIGKVFIQQHEEIPRHYYAMEEPGDACTSCE